jgi:hypothetical protein
LPLPALGLGTGSKAGGQQEEQKDGPGHEKSPRGRKGASDP